AAGHAPTSCSCILPHRHTLYSFVQRRVGILIIINREDKRGFHGTVTPGKLIKHTVTPIKGRSECLNESSSRPTARLCRLKQPTKACASHAQSAPRSSPCMSLNRSLRR